jgi:hypothetical protein
VVKADTLDLATIFGKTVRYNVPLFQRPYVWRREKQWEPLWEDIQAVADRLLDETDDNDNIAHFLGAVVLEQTPNPAGKLESRNVIDGQQRLTTLQLLIAAARAEALQRGLTRDEVLALDRLVYNERGLIRSEDDTLKVLPTNADRDAFAHALALEPDAPLPKPQDDGIVGAYVYFRGRIAEWLDANPGAESLRAHMEALGDAFWRLLNVVVIDLEQGENSQIIFETLNARGTPLLAADLVKNAIFRSAAEEGANVEELFERYWKVLDSTWWRSEIRQGRLRRPRIDVFLYHWLTMRLVREGGAQRLYLDFRELRRTDSVPASVTLEQLRVYSDIYERFERVKFGEMGDASEQQFYRRLDVLDVSSAYPFLLWLYGPDGMSSAPDRDAVRRVIESWLVHRMVTRRPAKSYTQVFIELINLGRRSRGEGTLRPQIFIDYFRGAESDRNDWPRRAELVARFASMPTYNDITRARLRMLLMAAEDHLRGPKTEDVAIAGDLTIEHVMPQDWAPFWPLPADHDPLEGPRRRELLKHTIGNLTLATSALNPALSNAAWSQKREALQAHSLLMLTKDVVDHAEWTEADIEHRTARLTDVILRVWAPADDPSWDGQA